MKKTKRIIFTYVLSVNSHSKQDEFYSTTCTNKTLKPFFVSALCILINLYTIDSSAQSIEAMAIIIKQQEKLHPPTLTPMGWINDPSVLQLKQEFQIMLQHLAPSQQIVQQRNQQALQAMGVNPLPTEEEKKVDYYNKQALNRQKKEQELYAEINAIDNSRMPIDQKKLQENEKNNQKLRMADTNATEYKTYLTHYKNAYNELIQMLEGKTPVNLKRAVFIVENAFYKNKLNYEKYCKQIDSLVYICKWFMQVNGLNTKNYMACHYAIQKLYSEKITYTTASGKQQIFAPLIYDLSIYDKDRDEKDWTEQFVTKLLNIKMGQCHSMPLLYLIIANELNTNAYLAMAPNHSYIQFGNQYQIYSFETTNGTFTSPEWLSSSGYISATAIRNQIFLAPLTQEQVIAECLVDLESGLEFLCGKSDFSYRCANTTLQYFPRSIRAALTIHNVINAECAQLAKKYHYPKYENYEKYADLNAKFNDLTDYELKVEATGYQKIPKEQYEKWRQTANEEMRRREHHKYLETLQHNANEK